MDNALSFTGLWRLRHIGCKKEMTMLILETLHTVTPWARVPNPIIMLDDVEEKPLACAQYVFIVSLFALLAVHIWLCLRLWLWTLICDNFLMFHMERSCGRGYELRFCPYPQVTRWAFLRPRHFRDELFSTELFAGELFTCELFATELFSACQTPFFSTTVLLVFNLPPIVATVSLLEYLSLHTIGNDVSFYSGQNNFLSW